MGRVYHICGFERCKSGMGVGGKGAEQDDVKSCTRHYSYFLWLQHPATSYSPQAIIWLTLVTFYNTLLQPPETVW